MFVFLFGKSIKFGSLVLVISNVDILHFVLKLLSPNPRNVLRHLIECVTLIFFRVRAAHHFHDSLVNLDHFKALTEVPMFNELIHFLLTMERWRGQFVTPKRCIRFLSSGVDVVLVGIADQLLVVGG